MKREPFSIDVSQFLAEPPEFIFPSSNATLSPVLAPESPMLMIVEELSSDPSQIDESFLMQIF